MNEPDQKQNYSPRACPDGQASREQDYLTSGVFKTPHDAGELHMFFSPYIIPAGLTDKEVKICLELQTRRRRLEKILMERRTADTHKECLYHLENNYLTLEAMREKFSRMFGEIAFSMEAGEISSIIATSHNSMREMVPLPSELMENPMTRENFRLGIKILTADMDRLEK